MYNVSNKSICYIQINESSKILLKYNAYFQKVIFSQVKFKKKKMYFTAKFLYFAAKRQNCESNVTEQNVRFASLLQ